MEGLTLKQILINIPKRFFYGIGKMLGSRKTYILGFTAWMMIKTDVFPTDLNPWIWLALVVICLFGIDGLKILDKLRK